MQSRRKSTVEKPKETEQSDRLDPVWSDSATGEGAASALEKLKKLEQGRKKLTPSEERPSSH